MALFSRGRAPHSRRQVQRNANGLVALRGCGLGLEPLEPRLMMAADFGDAPTPYPTTLAENGPRHEAVGPQLGALRDTEADGLHSLTASGDADEDGVIFGALRVGDLGATATATVQGVVASGARLSAWIDFNGDGSFGGLGEQIADSISVVNGANVVTFDIPAIAEAGATIARFRISTAGNLGYRGAAADGEVEDYAVTLASAAPGAGAFSGERPVTTEGDQTFSVYAADVDGDGDMDVLSASLGDDEIAWMENDGHGAFTRHVIDNTAMGARSVFAADVDGDGDMDVLAASETDTTIAWYENDGNESFTARTITTQANGAKSVLAADMDGDGDLDAVAAHGTRIAWYENNGSQTFTQRLLPGAQGVVYGLYAADVDSDGDMDVLYTSSSEDEIGWYDNNGSQTFTAKIVASGVMGARAVAAADIDGDGDVDVAAASSDDATIAWYDNNGSETFTRKDIYTTATTAWSVAAGDVDGDGDVDVVGAATGNDRILFLENNGTEIFSPLVVATSLDGPRSVALADVDGDGRVDIVAGASIDDSVAWFQQQATGDYDDNDGVDGGDFLVWQRAFGSEANPAGTGADGNGDGFVNAADLGLWRSGFGFPTAGASAVAAGASAALSAASDGGSQKAGQGEWFVTADLFAAPTSSGAGPQAQATATGVESVAELAARPADAASSASAFDAALTALFARKGDGAATGDRGELSDELVSDGGAALITLAQ
ncbi:MAG: VCBS repeat-containing protein [Pirellulales bacterium]|nr:VCBS repeat-containing protein [Pirellulales bacterium]